MLNKDQMKVINAQEEVIFLLAGAGTGKTTVLIERLKRVLKNNNELKALVITFTKKATKELKRRIKEHQENVLITTFHGLCYRLLKDRNYQIVSLNELLLGGYSKEQLHKVELLKRNNIINRTVKDYNDYLKTIDRIDFNDLELLLLKRIKKEPSFKKHVKRLFDAVFIDEFQDTSINQYHLISYLKQQNTKLFAVGDPDQSIYGFRGASEKIITKFCSDFKATHYQLLINYRSAPTIIKKSNNLISYNKRRYRKLLLAHQDCLGIIKTCAFKDKNGEAKELLKEISFLLTKGVKCQEIAVLYRSHYLANEIKLAFFKHYLFDINLLTIHEAKGLEFKAVFIIGLNEGVLPLLKADIEEERRLFYVAVTRAKRYLYLYLLKTKKESRFLKELK
jgi:DNA helicase-2/ATP-dependent DNA helicase PcrA